MLKNIYRKSGRRAVPFIPKEKPNHLDGMGNSADGLAKIPLTQGKFAIVDKQFEYLSIYNWFFSGQGYAVRSGWKENGKKGTIFLHHCIRGFPLNKFEIDHINCDKLDNRMCNLRIVSHRENGQNHKRRKDGQTYSKYVGVTWDKQNNKWRSRIMFDGKISNLGTFETEEDASKAYIVALQKVR
jgi:hypothetical protein